MKATQLRTPDDYLHVQVSFLDPYLFQSMFLTPEQTKAPTSEQTPAHCQIAIRQLPPSKTILHPFFNSRFYNGHPSFRQSCGWLVPGLDPAHHGLLLVQASGLLHLRARKRLEAQGKPSTKALMATQLRTHLMLQVKFLGAYLFQAMFLTAEQANIHQLAANIIPARCQIAIRQLPLPTSTTEGAKSLLGRNFSQIPTRATLK
jgi:hypothetical protein